MLYGSMQEKAKLWADANTVKMVFINNEEETEALLQKNASCWSRLATPIIVEDLNDDEAVAFLMAANFMEQETSASRSTIHPITATAMPVERAERVVDLVGGRILHLIEFKRAWFRGIKFEETADELKDRERERLLKVSLSAVSCLFADNIGVDPRGQRGRVLPIIWLGTLTAMPPNK
jgi:hypothetical protein